MLRMNIMKAGEDLVVTVLPKSTEVRDPAAEQLIPLNLKGSPQELDAGFIEAIRSPVTKATGLMTNMAEYEKSVEKAEKESKAEKDRQETVSKYIKEAEAAEKAGKARDALAAYAKALEMDKTNTKIRLKVNSMKIKAAGCGDIFSTASPATPVREEPPAEEPEEEDYPGDEDEDE